MSHSPEIVFIAWGSLSDGGMPEDSRNLVASVRAYYSGPISLVTKPQESADAILPPDIRILEVNNRQELNEIRLDQFSPDAVFVFFEFSNLWNVSLAARVRKARRRYFVLPAWQLNEFLDFERPFPKGAVPTISASERNEVGKQAQKSLGVAEGSLTLRGVLRAVMRRTYRKTLGWRMLSLSSGILVFSYFEAEQVRRLSAVKNSNFIPVRFGTQADERPAGPDIFPQGERRNLVFWGRADYYYKGLDIILDAIAKAKQTGISTPFKFWVIGPDYYDGYRKIRDHAQRLGIQDLVGIMKPGAYTPGTNGLLRKADFCIMASRWDGFARTLREACVLGVPFITNRQTHFDKIVEEFGTGILFDTVAELAELLSDLDAPQVKCVAENAKAQREQLASYFSWPACGEFFVKQMTDESGGSMDPVQLSRSSKTRTADRKVWT